MLIQYSEVYIIKKKKERLGVRSLVSQASQLTSEFSLTIDFMVWVTSALVEVRASI